MNFNSTYLDLSLETFSPKIDQVILPSYGAGAMESFGLIFYRADYVDFESSLRNRIKAYTTLGHEISKALSIL